MTGVQTCALPICPTARVWDASTGEELALLAGHVGHIQSITVGPENMLITASTTDNTVRYWDLDERPGRAVAEMLWGGDSYVHRPHWFQLETVLTGSARLALIEYAIATVPRCLTPGQRASFGLPATPPRWCLKLKKWPYIKGEEDISQQ